MERTLFDNNKIVESLCQFNFKPVQDNTIYGQFWDILAKENIYTVKENISAVNFTLSGKDSSISPALVNAMKYSNKEQDKVIQLHNNNFSVHQVKKYQKWELFKDDIDRALSNFNKIADNQSTIERIELRAINVFDFPSEDFRLQDFFNVHVLYPEYLKDANANITLEFPLQKRHNFVVLRLKTSVQQKMNVVLDLSFVDIAANVRANQVEQIDEVLQFGHIELYKLFTSVMTDKSKALIK
jgi:uncharacterized protein (TIGR04255 family)